MAGTSIIDMLPEVVKEGRREAKRILDGLSNSSRISLQTNELVYPNSEQAQLAIRANTENTPPHSLDWHNRLIYGDNLLAMQALLAGDEASSLPSMRGRIDLIYIDPPYDSKADYRTKIVLPGADIEQKPTILEQFAYADTERGARPWRQQSRGSWHTSLFTLHVSTTSINARIIERTGDAICSRRLAR